MDDDIMATRKMPRQPRRLAGLAVRVITSDASTCSWMYELPSSVLQHGFVFLINTFLASSTRW